MRSFAKGDQYVTVIVETPKSLSDEQRELFEKLSESLKRYDDKSADGKTTKSHHEKSEKKKEDKGFFNKMKDLFTDDDDDNNDD